MPSLPSLLKNKSFSLLTIIFVCFLILFYPFWTVIALSVITAFFAQPLYNWLCQKTKPALAMMLTWVAIFLVIIVPVAIISTVTLSQLDSMIQDAQTLTIFTDGSSLTGSSEEAKFWNKLENVYNDNKEYLQQLEGMINNKIAEAGSAIVAKAGGLLKSFPVFFIKLMLFMFITSTLLTKGIEIKNTIRQIVPIEKDIFDIFLEKIKHMTRGIMVGNFAIAGIQATTTAISFMLAGLPYVGIVFMVSFLLYIPMIGAVILYLPATIYLIIKGKYITAFLLFLWNGIAVANIDNIFRGKFLPEEAQIDSTLIFISVLSGVMLFGVLGVLYGPLLAVVGVTAINLYQEMQAQPDEQVAKVESGSFED